MKQPGFFDSSDLYNYESLSKFDDPFERINAVIDFEVFCNPIEAGLCFSDGSKGGWPPYDGVKFWFCKAFTIYLMARRYRCGTNGVRVP